MLEAVFVVVSGHVDCFVLLILSFHALDAIARKRSSNEQYC